MNNTEVIQRIKWLMNAHHVNATEISKKCQWPFSKISKILNGHQKIHTDDLYALGEALMVNPAVLIIKNIEDVKDYDKAYREELLAKAKRLINMFCIYEYEHKADFTDLNEIPIAHTTDIYENNEYEIQITVDLEKNSIKKYVEGCLVAEDKYNDLYQLIKEELENLSFDELVNCSEEDWNQFVNRQNESYEVRK